MEVGVWSLKKIIGVDWRVEVEREPRVLGC